MDTVPKTKTAAAVILQHALIHLYEGEMDYNARKTYQLLEALSDNLISEVRIESWLADLGTNGCQGDNNSIGGISCIAGEENV